MSKGQNKKATTMPGFRRIVVKLGTSLLTGGTRHLQEERMASIVAQVAKLHESGRELIVVSSGAIASGRDKLGMTRKIKGIPYKQVLASVGQNRLMSIYEKLFERHGITTGQALLTKTDLSDRSGYLNARNTLLALMELRVICIVNENDIVAIDEIQEAKFGDNDNLSAMVANLVDADLLMLLTDTAGLYDANPKYYPDACLIPEVCRIDESIEKLAADTDGDLGTGGMKTKIEAARLATASGVHAVIADGREADIIPRLASGEATGTHFLPVHNRPDSRKRWMLSGLCTRGKIFIDAGAATAIGKQNRSLLASGIKKAEGNFNRGDIVAIHDTQKSHLGYGITNYSSLDIDKIKGVHSGEIASLIGCDYGPEVVHRNNLALLEREEPSEHRQTLQLQR